MKNTCSQTIRTAFSRMAAGCQRGFRTKLHDRRAVARWAATGLLVLAGGLAEVRAVDDIPGEIKGKIKWTNSVSSAVGAYLDSSVTPHGWPRKNFSVIWPGIKLRLGWGLGR